MIHRTNFARFGELFSSSHGKTAARSLIPACWARNPAASPTISPWSPFPTGDVSRDSVRCPPGLDPMLHRYMLGPVLRSGMAISEWGVIGRHTPSHDIYICCIYIYIDTIYIYIDTLQIYIYTYILSVCVYSILLYIT